jgi:Flp pilus assembly pilin Flp
MFKKIAFIEPTAEYSAACSGDECRKTLFGEANVIPRSLLRGEFISCAKTALRRMKSKKGQTLAEYALILAFISVVVISVLSALGVNITGVFSTITSQVAIAGSGASCIVILVI